MKINLRKASALQNSINETLRHIELRTRVSLNEFENSGEVLEQRRNELMGNINRKIALTKAAYEIRQAVAAANNDFNINTKLTEVACIEKQIQVISALTTETPRESDAVITGSLDKIRTRKEKDYYHKDTVETGVLTVEDIRCYKASVADLKKSKQRIQDEILEANVRGEIVLSELLQKVLQEEGLL